MSFNDKYQKAKKHVADHKIAYAAGAAGIGGVVIGGAIVYRYGSVVDSFKLIHVQYKSPNINVVLDRRACQEPIPVLDKLTGETFASIRRAGQATRVNIGEISKDLHGSAGRAP